MVAILSILSFSLFSVSLENDWKSISGQYRTIEKEGKKLEQYSWGGPSCLSEERYYEGESSLDLWSCTSWPDSPWKSTTSVIDSNADGKIDGISMDMRNLPKGSPSQLWYRDSDFNGIFDTCELWLGGSSNSGQYTFVYRDINLDGKLDIMHDVENKKEYIMLGLTWTEAEKDNTNSHKNEYFVQINGSKQRAIFKEDKWVIEK